MANYDERIHGSSIGDDGIRRVAITRRTFIDWSGMPLDEAIAALTEAGDGLEDPYVETVVEAGYDGETGVVEVNGRRPEKDLERIRRESRETTRPTTLSDARRQGLYDAHGVSS